MCACACVIQLESFKFYNSIRDKITVCLRARECESVRWYTILLNRAVLARCQSDEAEIVHGNVGEWVGCDRKTWHRDNETWLAFTVHTAVQIRANGARVVAAIWLYIICLRPFRMVRRYALKPGHWNVNVTAIADNCYSIWVVSFLNYWVCFFFHRNYLCSIFNASNDTAAPATISPYLIYQYSLNYMHIPYMRVLYHTWLCLV